MTRLHESMTSSHLALRGITHLPPTQASAPSSPLVSGSYMHVSTLYDKQMDNTEITGIIVDNDTSTSLITPNQCMLTSYANSHNPCLIYPSITSHHCVYLNLT